MANYYPKGLESESPSKIPFLTPKIGSKLRFFEIIKFSRRKNHTYENIFEKIVCILKRPKMKLCDDKVVLVKFP